MTSEVAVPTTWGVDCIVKIRFLVTNCDRVYTSAA